MVRGIESFRDWFHDYKDQYVIIGGTACDLLMREEGLDFRATKDIDMVLIIEAVDSSFGKHFWEYVIAAGYQHLNKSTGGQQFYRFTNPRSHDYPNMTGSTAMCLKLPALSRICPSANGISSSIARLGSVRRRHVTGTTKSCISPRRKSSSSRS